MSLVRPGTVPPFFTVLFNEDIFGAGAGWSGESRADICMADTVRLHMQYVNNEGHRPPDTTHFLSDFKARVLKLVFADGGKNSNLCLL